MTRIVLIALLPLALGGCVRAAIGVVTFPVKVAATGVDVLTTSQSEADEKRGRRIRQYEECIGKEDRRAARARRQPDFSRCGELQPR